jgi:sulfite exporter TauE/SafE
VARANSRLKKTSVSDESDSMIKMEAVQFISLLSVGFLLGLKHALEADHVVAVSTLISQTKSIRKSSLAGAAWGIGHTATLLLVGLVLLTFKLTIPDKLALAFEFSVGIALVALGIDVLRKVRREKIHVHAHEHDGKAHLHLHRHADAISHDHIHKSFLIGTIHGLAGSAALTLLILATVKSTAQGLLYILVFGVGSIIGMLMVSGAIALPFLWSQKIGKVDKGMKVLAGSISIALGLATMYQIGFVSGLFA